MVLREIRGDLRGGGGMSSPFCHPLQRRLARPQCQHTPSTVKVMCTSQAERSAVLLLAGDDHAG